MYDKWDLLKKRNDNDFKINLYNDYKVLNKYFINKYLLKDNLLLLNDETRFDDLEKHSINNICNFDFKTLLKELNNDFNEEIKNTSLTYFNYSLLDEYVNECSDICIEEIKSILLNDKSSIDEKLFSWNFKK